MNDICRLLLYLSLKKPPLTAFPILLPLPAQATKIREKSANALIHSQRSNYIFILSNNEFMPTKYIVSRNTQYARLLRNAEMKENGREGKRAHALVETKSTNQPVSQSTIRRICRLLHQIYTLTTMCLSLSGVSASVSVRYSFSVCWFY